MVLFIAFKRAFGRVTHAKTGESFNYYFKTDGVDFEWVEHDDKVFPPRLKATPEGSDEELKRRPDDANADSVLRRIDTFLETTQPLIEYFDKKGIVKTVNADQPINTVTADIKKIIDAVK